MDMYQDITICSKCMLDLKKVEDKKRGGHKSKETEGQIGEQTKDDYFRNEELTQKHLMEVHRKIVDSVHETEIGSQIGFFSKIVEKRANALLFNEETMNFYQYNLQIVPQKIGPAVVYLMKLMNTLLQHDSKPYADLSRLIFKTARKTFALKEADITDAECQETR